MNTVTQAKTHPRPVQLDRYSGEFDALIGLPPQSQDWDYLLAYLRKSTETGSVPF